MPLRQRIRIKWQPLCWCAASLKLCVENRVVFSQQDSPQLITGGQAQSSYGKGTNMGSDVKANPPGTTHQTCPFGGGGTIMISYPEGRASAICSLASAIGGATLASRETNLKDRGCPRPQLLRSAFLPVPLTASERDCIYADGKSHPLN